MKPTILLMLAPLVLVGASRVTASPTRAAFSPLYLQSIHMVTHQAGWGHDQSRILRTVDGGRHWQDVTPAIPHGKGYSIGFLDLDVIDGRTAWLSAPNALGSTAPTAAYFFHTTDAGRTWQRLPLLHIGRYYYATQLQFIDAVHGWVVIIRDVATMHLDFDIYSTRDGARYWVRVAREGSLVTLAHYSSHSGLPACDCNQTYTFSSPTTGWVGGCYCGIGPTPQLFFRSTDGGRFWRPYPLTLPPHFRGSATATGAPVFFTPRVAVLPVYLLTRASSEYFDGYHTLDGGHTWYGSTPIKVHGTYEPSSFVDPQHSFVLDGRRLLRTSDGGRHWQVGPSGLSRENLSALDFVTPTIGFAIEGIGATNRSRLLETADSGHTWHVMLARLVPRG